ncbi:autotransporter domain-containing protein [uncultured Methylobacterium sp.]|uniref:autotransporter outer membrane beta-barrel domain-containing protein n=1 Tax=uncultured Methylobacterium sp. TaxID=157278 RepID=UPI0035CB0A04
MGTAAPGLADGPTTQFTVGGQVTAARTFQLSDLQALPAQTQTVSFLNGNSSTTTTFTGPTLWSLLNDTVGLRLDPATRNDVLRSAVIATGSDGYQAVYALGELSPSFGGSTARPELVAYASTPGRLLTTDGFARTTEPGDIRGGRYVSNVESIDVLHAPRMTGTFPGGSSSQFTVTGSVNAPATFNLATLTALGATTVNAPASGASAAASFTGVPLWTVLQAVGITANPAVRNNLLRDFVIATGSDGYQSTISIGEINPDFGANTSNPILVAYAMNGGAPGTSLGTNGFARLVLPDDNQRGRWVSNLVNLELFDVSQWKVLAGESLDMAGFSYRTLGFTLSGGTLTSSLGPATLTAPSYQSNGGIVDTDVTLGGTGTLSQLGGTTVLRGRVATPDVLIAGGTLQLAGEQRLATATTLTMSGGTFDLNGFAQTIAALNGRGTVSLGSPASAGTLAVGSGTFGGVIVDGGARGGSLIKEGPGTLTLTGGSTYTGGTTVSGGTLIGSAASFGTGAIVNAATLVIDQATDASLANALSGPGQLVKAGSGSLTLTGADTLSGGTSVVAGRLAVNGSLANSIVTVGTGAVLGGTGTVGGIVARAGGTVAPGNSIGTLNVAGNVGFASGSVYQVEANAAGQSDRIAATGTAVLAGGTVQVLAAAGTYDPRTRYAILTAAGGVTGQFAGVAANFAFLTPTLRYQADAVDLTLTRNDIAFSTIAQNRNQAAVATAIQAGGPGTGIYAATVGLTTPEAQGAFQRLAGDIHAGTVSTEYETAFFVREAILDRLRWGVTPGSAEGLDYGRLPAAYTADLPGRSPPVASVPARILDPKVFGLWGQGFGAFGDARGDGNTAGLSYHISGFVLGADVRLESGFKFGIAGGYTSASLDTAGRLQSATIASGFGGLYGSYEGGPVSLRLGAVYADNDARTRRTVVFAGLADNPAGHGGGSTIQGFGELGYRVFLGVGQTALLSKDAGPRSAQALSYIEPFVGGSYVSIGRDRFVEAGGIAALTSFSRTTEVGALTAGLRARTSLDLGLGLPLSAHGLVGYRRAFGDVVPTALLAFGTGPAFLTAGIPIARDALVAEAGLDLRVASNATLGVAYTGQAGDRITDHAVKGNVTYRF